MSDQSSKPEDTAKTLSDDDIETEYGMDRRSALGALGATLLGAAAVTSGLAALAPESAEAQTDQDTGRYADRAGGGRTGVTDNDSGSGADRAGHGRGRRAAPRPRRPPRASGCTDRDSGRNADPGGNGRRCGRRRSCSDSDNGRWADPGGRGRHC